MFINVSNFPVTIENKKYMISLGYNIPEDSDINDENTKLEFCYVLSTESEEGKFIPFDKPVEEDEESKKIFDSLVSTAQVYSRGFIDGTIYTKEVLQHSIEKSANDNKIITD